MLADPDRVGEILADATSCLVTVPEHDRLTHCDSSADGWDRCRLAGVDVYDFSSDPPLDGAVPSAAGRRMSPLPKGISAGELERLLDRCDRHSARGLRDYAVLNLLSRLGLRAGEVAAMVLEDIDWRRGEIVVHGKVRHDETLPLPEDVGEAITAYLQRGRPQADSRSVFLRCYASRQGLSAQAVTGTVYDACGRARSARSTSTSRRESR
jgi:site-specific recombinase XerD